MTRYWRSPRNLPHLIAYTIVGHPPTDLEDSSKSEVIEFSASGFRDFTRIAASDPVMWRDVFLNNRESGARDPASASPKDLTACSARSAGGRRPRLQISSPVPGRSAGSIIEAKQA